MVPQLGQVVAAAVEISSAAVKSSVVEMSAIGGGGRVGTREMKSE